MHLYLTGLIATASTKPAFVPLRVAGFGRYGGYPALFLSAPDAASVLPVPVPLDSVMAIEQALAPVEQAMFDVLLQCRSFTSRDCGIFDALPWNTFSSSPMAKRDAFSRLQGRGYPAGGYVSPYHLLLDAMRLDGCAVVTEVVIENTDLLGDLVLGGALLVERRSLEPGSLSSAERLRQGVGPSAEADRYSIGQFEPELCSCTPDEALGVAMALGLEVRVESCVWKAASVSPRLSEQRGKLRIAVDAPATSSEARRPAVGALLPWELGTAEEVASLSREEQARSLLAAGVRLPRAREATEEVLRGLMEPLLDEDVRRQLRLRRALEEEDLATAAELEAGASRRGQLLGQLRQAVSAERYGEAAELALELRVETERRADVTQDEGAYSSFLDQDDWYAQGLAREREQLLQKERERQERLDAEGRRVDARRVARGMDEREVLSPLDSSPPPPPPPAPPPPPPLSPLSPPPPPEVSLQQPQSAQSAPPPGLFRFDTPQAAGPVPPRWDQMDSEWTDELEAAVLRQMLGAFDNYQPAEVKGLLNALIEESARGGAKAEQTLRKLAALTRQLEALARAASAGADAGMVQEEARTLYSQVRMWGKDGEKYMPGEAGDSWLGWLNDLGKGL